MITSSKVLILASMTFIAVPDMIDKFKFTPQSALAFGAPTTVR